MKSEPKFRVLRWAMLVMSCLAGCGSGASGVYRGNCGRKATGQRTFCYEILASSADALNVGRSASCQGAGWNSGGCASADSLGGCSTVFHGSTGSAETVAWYYSSPDFQTAADVMQACGVVGATYLPPGTPPPPIGATDGG